MAKRLRFAVLLLALAPSVALADDDLPVYGPEPRPSADPWASPTPDPDPTRSPDPWASPTSHDFERPISLDEGEVDQVAEPEQTFAKPPPKQARRYARCGGVHGWKATWRERWGNRGYHHTPRLAIGFAKSKVELDEGGDSKHKSLLARLVLRRGVEMELELSKLEVLGEDARTAGISVMRVFGRRAVHPYIIAGLGGGTLDAEGRGGRRDDAEPRVHYAELGGGIMLRKRHLAIAADLRRGVRTVEGLATPDRMSTARTSTPDDDRMADPDRYTRGRIMMLVYF
jgi:hypothetical protein